MRKIMFITGGSRGIGAATAQLAARHGYDVALTYRHRSDRAEQVAHSVREQGGRALVLCGEVSCEETVAGWFEQLGQDWGRLDCLVNNAGIVAPQSRLEDFSLQRVQRVFEVNVFGVFLCLRHAVQLMSTRHGGRGGSIVNVSSAASYIGSPHEYIDYAASKGAVDSMTLGLAKEVAAEGIRVNAVRPGLIETELHAEGGEPGRVQRLAPAIPLQRGGTAQEIAESILFLAGEKSSYITGALLNCSGGR